MRGYLKVLIKVLISEADKCSLQMGFVFKQLKLIHMWAGLLFVSFQCTAQKVYSQNYFASPLTIPLVLSGNFGEIRGNHFHSGLDFKTENREGFPVLASADGYVYRIKVSEGGYGNVLYMQHDNGYSTVYAHLHSFQNNIAAIVLNKQYGEKKFEVEIYPDIGSFFFKKGDTIGFSGNSGGSFAPHLHFEIRQSDYDMPVNPLLFDLPVSDTMPPILKNIFIYPQSTFNDPKMISVRSLDGKHYFTEEIVEATNPFYVGFSADDFAITDSNNLGIYKAVLLKESDTVYSYLFNSFDFDKTKYLNAHIDYKLRGTKKQVVERCFVAANNQFPVYSKRYTGRVTFNDTASLELLLADFAGHEISLQLKVAERSRPISLNPSKMYYWNKPNIISGAGFQLKIPDGCFFENTYLPKPHSSFQKKKWILGNTITFSEVPVPLATSAMLSISKPIVSARLQSKLCIVSIDNSGNLSYIGGNYKAGKITSKVNKIGKFAVAIDTLPPVINESYSIITDSVTMKKRLVVKVSDNLSGIRSYNAYVNGKWELMEYEPKRDAFYLNEEHYVGKSLLVIEVMDKRGNQLYKEIDLKSD